MGEQETFDFKDYLSKLTPVQKRMLELVENESVSRATNFAHESLVLNKSDKLFNYIVLCTALSRHHKSMSLFLLRVNCPVIVPQKTSHYCTPLHYAVKWRHLEVFKMLWKRGASVFDKDANNDSTLELAMINEEKHIVDFIFDETCSKNLRVFRPDVENDVALFHAACWNGNLKPIEMFVSYKFSLDSRSTFIEDDWKGFTPLHFLMARSSYYGRELVVKKFLLLDEVDLFATDEKGRTPIHIAFRKDERYLSNNDIVIDRISCSNKNQFINFVDKSGLSHFHIVCSVKCVNGDDEKHIKNVKYFIDNGVDLNSSISLEDEHFPGYTALHLIVKNSCWGILELLLKNGADPTKVEKNELTPLHLVCPKTHMEPEKRIEVVKLLLQYGADPFAKDLEDRTPLHTAFYARYSVFSSVRALDESEKLLLSRNHQGINYIDKKGISYLHLACLGDVLNLVRVLVQNGAPISSSVSHSTRECRGYFPIHFAAQLSRVEIAKFLLDHGADVNCINACKDTPLHLACCNEFEETSRTDKENNASSDNIEWLPNRRDNIRIIELLLNRGASINAKCDSGYTPLLKNFLIPCNLYPSYFYGRKKPSERSFQELFIRQREIMFLLLRHGADINDSNRYAGTILHILCDDYEKYPFRKELAEIALNVGAIVNATDQYKKFTPLHEAVEVSMKNKSDTSLVDLFLKYGANINAKCNKGNTPLHIAVEPYYCSNNEIHALVLSKLLDHLDIDVNIRNNLGQTPLFIAIARKNCSKTEKLLECGANINLMDCAGRSPIHTLVERVQKEPYMVKNDKEFCKLLGVVVIHVYKLMRLGSNVSENVYRDFTLLSQYLSKDYLARVDSQIVQELALLKTRRLNSHTSFYDILFKDSIAMSKYTLNSDLQAAISSIIAKSAFIYFGNFIKRQYDRGCRRRSLIESAKSALNFITHLDWPCCCSDQILKHLTDENLRKLIQSVPCISRNNKRSASGLASLGESAAKALRLDDENHCKK